MFIPWSGLLAGAVATGGSVAFAMGSLLIGLLAATSFALLLGTERRPRQLEPTIALKPPAYERPAAA